MKQARKKAAPINRQVKGKDAGNATADLIYRSVSMPLILGSIEKAQQVLMDLDWSDPHMQQL